MPLLWFSLAFLSGILLEFTLALPVEIWLGLGTASLMLLLLRPYIKRYAPFTIRFTNLLHLPIPLAALLLSLSLGALRYTHSLPNLNNPNFIAWYNQQEGTTILEGVLIEPPDLRDWYANLRVEIDQLRPPGKATFVPVHGLVLARVYPQDKWQYGDRLQLEGELQAPPEFEDFSYRDYLARQNVYSYLPKAQVKLLMHNQGNRIMALIYTFKERAIETVYKLYPDPEASLLAGILLGVETGIPEPVRTAFNDTGTAHIIAISGFNITILAGLFTATFNRLLGRWRGAVATTAAIGVYTMLVGADATVVRAALMGGLTVFAVQLGRRQNGLNSLAFVAAVMALFNPLVLWDVGFQLSFAATLGLVLYAGPLTTWFTNFANRFVSLSTAQRLAGWVGEYLFFTLAAQLTTLPLIAYYFKRLSLVSLIANPVILPVQPPLMVLGGLAVLLGLVYLPLGQITAYLAWPFVVFTIRAVEVFNHLQGGAWVLGKVALPILLVFYALLFLVTFAGQRFSKLFGLFKPGLALVALGSITLLVWRATLAAPDGRLHLYVLDVSRGSSSGEALLLQSPSGRYLLIDGGPSSSLLSDALGRRLPLLHRQLDWVIIAGTKENQIAALSRVLERYPPSNVLWSETITQTNSARYLKESLAQWNVRVIPTQAGQILDLGSGASLRVLATSEWGATLLVEWDNFRALLPVGLDFNTLYDFQNDPSMTPVTAFTLVDRGRASLNPPEWIATLHPQVVLLSVSAGDWNRFPPPETLHALQGYTLLRTDRNGWIHLSTDGKQFWVEVEKQ